MIRLLQHYTPNFKPLIDISRPIHEEYCKLHGYSLHIKEVPEYGVYNGLEKLSQILEVCEDGDVALVIDGDAIITNLLFNVERFLQNDKDFYVAQGWNMGVFIVRITPASIKLLNHIFFWIKEGKFNCEQDAFEFYMQMYLLSEATDIIATVPHPCFNSYLSELYPSVPQPVTEQQGQWVEGRFILHLPALPLSQRAEIMKNIKITR